MREENRKSNLISPEYQGSSIYIQSQYEINLIMAMQTINWRENARQAKSKKEKQIAEEKAKQYANYLLNVEK